MRAGIGGPSPPWWMDPVPLSQAPGGDDAFATRSFGEIAGTTSSGISSLAQGPKRKARSRPRRAGDKQGGSDPRPLGDERVDTVTCRVGIGADHLCPQIDDDQRQGGKGGVVASPPGFAMLISEMLEEPGVARRIVPAPRVRDFELVSDP